MQLKGVKIGNPLKRRLPVFLAAVVLLVCTSCSTQGKEELDDLKIEYDRFLLAEVAQSMDNYLTIYAYLSDSLMELSEDPSNSQLQEKLTGALEGIYVAKVGNLGMEWRLFEAYSNNHQELCSVMQDVSLSYLFSDETDIPFFSMSQEQLEEVSRIYYALSYSFYRGNSTSFASLIVDRELEGEDFQAALEKTKDWLSELNEFIQFNP